ncbi:MAG: DUF1836 domain-containing protein [Eggerthellaceae bacterium]
MNKKLETYAEEAEGFPALDWDAYLRKVASLHLPRYGDLPTVNLYMDQVIEYIGQQLALFAVPAEKPLTSSMVNNYVKRHVVPQPKGKRYAPLHVAYLIVIVLLKRIYSMDDIERLIGFDVEHRFQAPAAYDKFIDLFEASLKAQFLGRSEAGCPGGIETIDLSGAFAPVASHPDQLTHIDHLYLMVAISAAAKVYTEQVLVNARYQDAVEAVQRENKEEAMHEELHRMTEQAKQDRDNPGKSQASGKRKEKDQDEDGDCDARE